MVAIEDYLSFETARKVKSFEEHVSRIGVSFATIVIALANIVTVA